MKYSNYYATLDLHGYDRDYAKIMIHEFILDQVKLKKTKCYIVHGRGTGILKKMTQETLKRNRYVLEYKIDNFNDGMTVVTLK